MRAARFYDRFDIRIEDVDVPDLKSPDDVLVEVAWCGICGTDLHEYLVGPIVTPVKPHPLTGATLPQTLGHEFSARVVETGSEVAGVTAGDRVAIMPAIVCGKCDYCRRGLGHLCVKFACTGLSAETGGLAQFAVAQGLSGFPLPDEVSDLEGRSRRAGQRGRVRDRSGGRARRRRRAHHGCRADRRPLGVVRQRRRRLDRRDRRAEPESGGTRSRSRRGPSTRPDR